MIAQGMQDVELFALAFILGELNLHYHDDGMIVLIVGTYKDTMLQCN